MYKLSPSKAHRYLTCTKSLEFDTAFVETPYTIRGSLLHELGEMLITNQSIDAFMKEHKITDYEIYLLQKYVDAVWSEKDLIGANTPPIVEEKRNITLYDNSINLIIDTLLVGQDTISIIDLKTGNNDIDPNDNEQLLFYAYSVVNDYIHIKNYRLSIFQKGQLKTATVTQDEVLDFFMDKFLVFQKINKDELEYNPSDKACKYCAIKDTCRARADWIIGGKQ